MAEINEEIMKMFRESGGSMANFKLSNDALAFLRNIPPSKSPNEELLDAVKEKMRKVDEPILKFLRESNCTLEELEESCRRVSKFWHLIDIQQRVRGMVEFDRNDLTTWTPEMLMTGGIEVEEQPLDTWTDAEIDDYVSVENAKDRNAEREHGGVDLNQIVLEVPAKDLNGFVVGTATLRPTANAGIYLNEDERIAFSTSELIAEAFDVRQEN